MSVITIVTQVVLGLLYGAVVSFFNHQILVRGWNKVNSRSIISKFDKLKRNIMVRYAVHFFIDVLALLLVAKWMPALLGTAAGIVITQKILIVKYIKTDKEVKIR
ncbi:MAG: hypothetical protein Q4C00_02395 [Bacillota bacterium]|nr:hypothetical protein [Bacillota bacterium]